MTALTYSIVPMAMSVNVTNAELSRTACTEISILKVRKWKGSHTEKYDPRLASDSGSLVFPRNKLSGGMIWLNKLYSTVLEGHKTNGSITTSWSAYAEPAKT